VVKKQKKCRICKTETPFGLCNVCWHLNWGFTELLSNNPKELLKWINRQKDLLEKHD